MDCFGTYGKSHSEDTERKGRSRDCLRADCKYHNMRRTSGQEPLLDGR